MTPDVFLCDVIRPGLADLHSLGGPIPSRPAERFLLAIAGQEADHVHRFQGSPRDLGGPARSWWQFEPAGALGVLTHSASSALAEEVCRRYHVLPHAAPVTRALEGHDRLAVAFARLLVWTHPRALPATEAEGWRQYLDLWRPGRPRQDRWAQFWRSAHEAVHAND